ncbi:MAG: formylglycine-generating enzyme family protein, partial [Myxococcaceae bacterium]
TMGHEKLPKPPWTDEDRASGRWIEMPINDWYPPHEVFLSPFYLDKYEVTNGQYKACVEAGICKLLSLGSVVAWNAYQDPAHANRPIDHLDFEQAVTYCLWSGKRLPTEAEWERAARGPKGFDYPWGNDPPGARFDGIPQSYNAYNIPTVGIEMPPEVGTTPLDVSAEGVHDLYTSVQEHLSDWYHPFYYEISPRENPKGPAQGVKLTVPHEYNEGNTVDSSPDWRAARGARVDLVAGGNGWDFEQLGRPVWFRGSGHNKVVGIRCARDDSPPGTPPPNGIWEYRDLKWRSVPGGSP